jgi:ankyrin repeat protein
VIWSVSFEVRSTHMHNSLLFLTIPIAIFLDACAKANTALIVYLVETDPPAASVRAKNGETPLHVLCRQKQLQCGCSYGNNDDDDVPYLAAMRALIRAAPETVVWKTIPLAARDVLTRRTVPTTGYTPIHYLMRESRSPRSVVPVSLVQALVKASPSCAAIPDGNQYLPLHYACEAGSNASVDVIACLLSASADSVKAVTRKRDTALHLACATNKISVETVRLLLQQYPAATLMANEYGFIPLHGLARAYQPSLAICQALLEASPTSIHVLTRTGESAVHLATSNCSVSAAVLACLTRAAAVSHTAALQDKPKKKKPLKNSSFAENLSDGKRSTRSRSTPLSQTNGTPLHEACNSRRGQIESIATLHPEWITVGNNAGFTPLQILCKSGCMDDAPISLFSRIAGPTSFQAVDLMGNTPLHYAMREETNVEAVQALIRAFPEALHMKTIYGDTPLHLACLRRVDPKVVAEVAVCSCAGLEKSLAICNQSMSPLLMENTAGQTPIAIAMQEFQKSIKSMESSMSRGNLQVHQEFDKEQQRSFDVLAALVKMLHYGPPLAAAARHNNDSDNDYNIDNQSLVHACVALHRKSVRLHPVFIRRALRDNPDEARLPDGDGNYPLHSKCFVPCDSTYPTGVSFNIISHVVLFLCCVLLIICTVVEASIPIEKMFMLNGPNTSRWGESCHDRMGVLPVLLEMFPEAAKIRSACGSFPLGLMVTSGRPWDETFAFVVRSHPEAFHWINGITSKMVPRIISK